MNNFLAQIDFNKINVPTNLVGQIKLDNSLTIGAILGVILRTYIFYVAGIILLIYLVIGGFQYMLSKGEPKAMQSAQAKITHALIGFVIIFLAFLIVQLIALIFGLDDTLFGEIFNL